MLVSLLVGAALARPPQLSLAAGPAVGGGESTRGSFLTVAPISTLTVGWHFGPLDSWVGVSGSLLLAGQGDAVVPASLLQGEVGLGLGGPGLGGGVYGGNGWPGPVWGFYARATLPRAGWLHRVGLESRVFFTEATHSSAVAVMLRVEPAWPGAERRRRELAAEETRGAADAVPAVEVPEEALETEAVETEASEGEVLAYPVDAMPPAAEPASAPATEPAPLAPAAPATETPPPAHHEEPF